MSKKLIITKCMECPCLCPDDAKVTITVFKKFKCLKKPYTPILTDEIDKLQSWCPLEDNN